MTTSELHIPGESVRRCRWLGAALVLLVALVFGRVVGHSFLIWDDEENLLNNPRLNPPSFSGIGHYFQSPEHGLYMPATYTVWSILAWVGRSYDSSTGTSAPNPAVFHAASVFLHAVNTLLVFSILRRLSLRDVLAALGAAVFATHPVQVETVAWACGSKDLLAAAGVLTAIRLHVGTAQTGRRRTVFLATAAYVLAMLCKPIAVVTPILVLLIDLMLLARPPRVALRTFAGWAALALPVMVVARLAQSAEDIETVRPLLRPLVMTDAVAFYLCKLAWPVELAIDYGRRPLVAAEQGWIYFTWILPAALIAGLLIFRRRAKPGLAALLLFISAMLPVLGALPFLFQRYSTVADHYLYLPMFGAAIAAAFAANHRLIRLAIVVIVAAMGIRSFMQAGVWKTDTSLYTHAISINPRSFVAWNNLGVVADRQLQPDRAAELFRRSIDSNPEYRTAQSNLAQLLVREATFQLKLGRSSRAIEMLKESLKWNDGPAARQALEAAERRTERTITPAE